MIELEALVIDDEFRVRILMQRMLSRLGVETTDKDNGSSGLAEYLQNQGKYDIIFTDMKMPGLDGLEVIKGILAVNPSENGIYGMTGCSEHTPEVISLIGADNFFHKPFRFADIQGVVNRVGTKKLMQEAPVLSGLSYIMQQNDIANLGTEVSTESGVSTVRFNYRNQVVTYQSMGRGNNQNTKYIFQKAKEKPV